MASLTYIRDDSGRVAGITTRVRTDPTAPEPEPDPDPHPGEQVQPPAEQERKEEA